MYIALRLYAQAFESQILSVSGLETPLKTLGTCTPTIEDSKFQVLGYIYSAHISMVKLEILATHDQQLQDFQSQLHKRSSWPEHVQSGCTMNSQFIYILHQLVCQPGAYPSGNFENQALSKSESESVYSNFTVGNRGISVYTINFYLSLH